MSIVTSCYLVFRFYCDPTKHVLVITLYAYYDLWLDTDANVQQDNWDNLINARAKRLIELWMSFHSESWPKGLAALLYAYKDIKTL